MITDWRILPSFPDYAANAMGQIKSLTRRKGSRYGRILNGQRRYHTSSGKLLAIQVTLRYERVHRLVLEAFVGPCPMGMEGCHNDGNPENNQLHNLRWDTHKSNMEDSIRHGTKTSPPSFRGEKNSNRKLTDGAVAEIRARFSSKRGVGAGLAREFGVSYTHIRRIVDGLTRAINS